MYQTHFFSGKLGGPIQWFFQNKPTKKDLHTQTTAYFNIDRRSQYLEEVEKEVRKAIDLDSFEISFQIVEVPLISN